MNRSGTCVAVGGAGVLLLGPSGAGKSDLALRLVHEGGELVADDRVDLAVRGGRLRARPPAAIRGLLEVRGLGVFRVPFRPEADVVLAADLDPAAPCERMPAAERLRLCGVEVPCIRIRARSPSAAARVRLAVSGAESVAGALGDAPRAGAPAGCRPEGA